MTSTSILVVDDEPQIRRTLRTTLSFRGYLIIEAATGEEALELVRKQKPDLILLDVNLPGISGIETCREIRRTTDAPIIMLTVRNAERDKVVALDAGADDYVTKPFGIEELLARIRASLRRHPSADAIPAFQSKDFAVDFELRRVTVAGEEVHLAPKEFEVLKQLIANQGKPVSHRRLLQSVWGPEYGEETENLRVVINQLRKKIEKDPSQPRYILTEPWVGYRFQLPWGRLLRHAFLALPAIWSSRPTRGICSAAPGFVIPIRLSVLLGFTEQTGNLTYRGPVVAARSISTDPMSKTLELRCFAAGAVPRLGPEEIRANSDCSPMILRRELVPSILLLHRITLIQIKIQFQHIHPRFS
jgi:two-component system KDP operon response regulator KdpE